MCFRMECVCGSNALQRLDEICEVCFEIDPGAIELFRRVCTASPERGESNAHVSVLPLLLIHQHHPPNEDWQTVVSVMSLKMILCRVLHHHTDNCGADVHREGGEYFHLPYELKGADASDEKKSQNWIDMKTRKFL